MFYYLHHKINIALRANIIYRNGAVIRPAVKGGMFLDNMDNFPTECPNLKS